MANNIVSKLLLLLSLLAISEAGDVFVSIDCGASDSSTDENLIIWTGDNDLFSNGGETQVVQSKNSVNTVMDTLRVFTSLRKNCYTIDVNKGGQVLVRASFNYGNYDGKSSPPSFDLQFDGNFWASVETTLTGVQVYEVTYVVKGDTMSVCLAQTKPGQFPFISALEVRSLDDNMYSQVNASYALLLRNRNVYGIDKIIRFPTDPYDRMWIPASIGPGLVNLTNEALFIDDKLPDNPPLPVLQTAVTTTSIRFNILTIGIAPITTNVPAYINWYFTEAQELNSSQLRSFRIYDNGLPFSLPILPPFGNVTEYNVANHIITPTTNFSLVSTGDSTLPPIISAIELFQVSGVLTDGTNTDDVSGLAALQTAFDVLNEWGGDPCLPASYSWEWINCSTTDATPRVTALNLDSFGLSGLLPDFGSMDALEIIDLRNNSLTGPIPAFLGTLPNLKQLNLANNAFSGPIPTSLTKNNKVNLIVTGNPLLCTSGKSCTSSSGDTSTIDAGGSKKKSSKLPVILGIIIPVFVVFWVIVGIVIILQKRRNAAVAAAAGGGATGQQMGGNYGAASNYNNNGPQGNNGGRITEMIGKIGEGMLNELKVEMGQQEQQSNNVDATGFSGIQTSDYNTQPQGQDSLQYDDARNA